MSSAKHPGRHDALQLLATLVRHSYGYATGFSLRLQHQTQRRRLHLIYSYDRTQRAYLDRYGLLRPLPTPWNEPHRLHAALTQNLPAGVAFLVSWESRWG